jgi:PPK2 family polyphosphate:nucleotide phosphotransferase
MSLNLDDLIITPGKPAHLAKRDPRETFGLDKDDAPKALEKLTEKLVDLQTRLAAEAGQALLVVLQGLDASGKDGTIRHVFSGVNPQGCSVVSFGAPERSELAHDYLWRVHHVVPRKGQIGIFNRSHYEDVLVVRVESLVPEKRWRARYAHIRDFERMLVDEGTTIVKIFLDVSADEQLARFTERVEVPEKQWKFRTADLEVHKKYDVYREAYEEALTETSTDHAPWYAVPADRNWLRNLAVSKILVETLEKMDPKYPEPQVDAAAIAELKAAAKAD